MSNPKKRAAESPDPLQEESRLINNKIRATKAKMVGKSSWNAKFWAASYDLENLMLEREEMSRKFSLRDFKGTQAEWEKTDQAQSIFQSIKAGEKMVALCDNRRQDLDRENWSKWRRMRASWTEFFSSSTIGLGAKTGGQGKRNSGNQSTMREELIRVGDAKHPKYDHLWCPVMGAWLDSELVAAAHLFPCLHGQSNMDAIFGKKRPAELFSARNGILMFKKVESKFDSGKLVIVPDLPDRPATAELLAWIRGEARDYRVKIIDRSWDLLNEPITAMLRMTWRELDGKKLEFRTTFRPAARYLYFHYCCQVLRRAWAHNTNGGAYHTLKDELGAPFWGTPGRYLPRNMLLGLVEELGHEYKDLLQGAGFSKGDGELLVEVVTHQIKERPALKDIDWYKTEDENEDESEEAGLD